MNGANQVKEGRCMVNLKKSQTFHCYWPRVPGTRCILLLDSTQNSDWALLILWQEDKGSAININSSSYKEVRAPLGSWNCRKWCQKKRVRCIRDLLGGITIKRKREPQKLGRAFTICREDFIFMREGKWNKFRLCYNSEEAFTKLTGNYMPHINRKFYVGKERPDHSIPHSIVKQ